MNASCWILLFCVLRGYSYILDRVENVVDNVRR